MKAIYKSLLAAVAVTPLLTGCIEESIATNLITQDQLEQSPEATAAIVYGMPGTMISMGISYSTQHYQFGFPALMHALDVMTDDMVVEYAGGYDWFGSFSQASYSLGEDYMVCQNNWNIVYDQVLACNKAVGAIDPDTDNPTLRAYLGAAYAYRAFTYLYAGSIYEVLPTTVTSGLSPDGNPILGLTLPIVTETTTEEECRNNPRATHEELFAFIEGDLTKAVSYLDGAPALGTKTLPSLSVAYGLMARLYLWDAQYDKAAEYARKAINTSNAVPLTREEWLSTTNGFNDDSYSAWMFSVNLEPENSAVKTSIINWTSFCSNEAQFGYAGAGAMTSIGASFYNRINDRDFRKLSYVAPEGTALSGQESYVDPTYAEEYFSPYVSLKIRPGSGSAVEYKTAAAVSIPLMRVEEMYFIEAEAKAHINPADGNELLKSFMRTYRYGTYANEASSEEDVVDEIIFQKRIELWGEGLNFFDVKRLDMDVVRAYSGSNFNPSLNSYNTQGRPAWMNFTITAQETENNKGILGYNTPDPYKVYSLISF